MIRQSAQAGALLILLLLGGCGGGSSAAPPPPPPAPSTITSVSIGSNPLLARTGGQIRFIGTVQGTGKFSTALTWSVNGLNGGNSSNGTISSTGVYTVPVMLPPSNPVTVTAASVQDPTKSGSNTVNVFTLGISPANATVSLGHTQQFAANVTGITSPNLLWSTTNGGLIDANGLYTPSSFASANSTDTACVNIAAVSTAAACAQITLQIPPPVVTGITPNGASASEPVSVKGQDLSGASKIYFPGPNGTMLLAALDYSSSLTQLNTSVPLGAISGNVVVQISISGTNSTVTTPFTRLPNLRIRAAQTDLSAGSTVQFQSRLLGASTPTNVNWSADLGNISNAGLYQAPSVSNETIATVTACLAHTRSCDSTMLRIVPLRIAPANPIVGMGQNLQLNAIQGSQISANWSVLAGGGSVNSSGLFAATSNPIHAGGIPVSASSGSASDVASVAVTGAFPGLISRSYDYMNAGYDPQTQQYLQRFEGTLVNNIAISGNRGYTLDVGLRASPPFYVNPPFTALEVYDISAPSAPVWMGAAESLISNPLLFSIYSHYLVEVGTEFFSTSIYNAPSTVALYDIQTNPPRLLSWIATPYFYSAYENNGVIYASSPQTYTGSTAPIYLFDVTTGAIQQNQVDLPVPAGAMVGAPPSQVIGTGNLVYCLFDMQSGGPEIATYDISVSPPNLLGMTPLNGSTLAGFNALIRGNLLFMGNVIFDISNSVPVQVGIAPVQYVYDVKGTRLLGRGFLPIYAAPDNYVVVDITNPANSTIDSSVYDFSGDFHKGKLIANGSEILTTQGLGGIATIDVSKPGGMIDKARVGVFPSGIIFDHAINQQTLYVVGASGLGSGGLETFDLSSGTPAVSGVLLYGQNGALAVQVANNIAFMGLLDSLKTVDVSDPTNPFESGSIALPTNALALSGNVLFDGTRDGRLVALNVSNPNSPAILGIAQLPGPAINLRLVGNTLFVADGPAGLLIFDVSNPSTPIQLSQLALSTPVWDVAPSGSLAFLAADWTGLVIVDTSNLTQPKQVGQTLVESYNPFPDFGDEGPRSPALAVAVQNGLVHVGTVNAAGLVFSYDCSQPSYPRLVGMNAFAEFIYTLVTGFSFSGNDIYVFGALGAQTDIVQADNSSPRNAIDLYYQPLSLRAIDFLSPQFASGPGGSAEFISRTTPFFPHPKLDPQFFERQQRYPKTWIHQGAPTNTPGGRQ